MAIFKYSAQERSIFKGFGLSEDVFLPLLLSIKAGGSWSYASEEIRSLAVKDVTTYYDEKEKTGYTLEEVYFFVNPEIVKKEGLIYRLEKCGKKVERELVTRPFKVTLQAERIILARINPARKRIYISEMAEKSISFTGTPAYGAAHELEHLEKGDVKGLSLWNFEYRIQVSEPDFKTT